MAAAARGRGAQQLGGAATTAPARPVLLAGLADVLPGAAALDSPLGLAQFPGKAVDPFSPRLPSSSLQGDMLASFLGAGPQDSCSEFLQMGSGGFDGSLEVPEGAYFELAGAQEEPPSKMARTH